MKDGRVGHRWDFCQRVSRKIARLVKKLLLVEAASFATYIFRTRPSFSYFSLSFSTPSYDPFSPRFSRENGKLVRRGREKARDERIFPSIPRAFSPRFRFPLEKFCAKDGLFSRQPGINERRARMCIRVVRQIGLE